jgi:integrase
LCAIEITKDRITAYIAHRQEAGAAGATINRELAALKRAFSLAEDAGRVAQRPRFALLHEDNARAGFFEPEQFAALLNALPGYLKPVAQTAYITGWRVPSEILTRQRHHLDLDGGWLRLDPGETKNGQGRNFPLTPELPSSKPKWSGPGNLNSLRVASSPGCSIATADRLRISVRSGKSHVRPRERPAGFPMIFAGPPSAISNARASPKAPL